MNLIEFKDVDFSYIIDEEIDGNSNQTIDIVLDGKYNAFYLDGTTSSNGKQNVKGYTR